MRKIFLILLFMTGLFANDATMEIVKRLEKLPVIALQDGTNDGFDANLKRRFFQMLIGDLKVSANFTVIDDYFKQDFNDGYRYSGIANPDFVLRYALEKNRSQLLVKIKLFDPKTANIKA